MQHTSLLSADSLSVSRGTKPLLNNVSFGIAPAEKVALIGPNGCGKSSLLAVLDGRSDDYEGDLYRNRELTISTLRQVPAFEEEQTILDYILSGDAPEIRLLRDYETCVASLRHQDTPAIQMRLGDLMKAIEKADAWDFEHRFASVLSELGINDTSLKMAELSGGMLRKVDLAHTLVQEADLLLLDEPTNHLDIATIRWLEDYLKRTKQAMVLVTHDRYFLDEVATTILEIENESLYRYEGNYSYYMEKKAEREEQGVREQAKIKNVLRRELAWLKQGPKARTGKQKARIGRADELASRVQKESTEMAAFEVGQRRLGKKVLEMEAVSKSYDDETVIHDFSRTIKKGERLGLLGPNGSGKTTLLKLMSGELKPDAGTVTPGVNTRFAVFDQTTLKLDPEMRLLDYLKEEAEHVRRADGSVLGVEQLLERFLFPKGSFQKKLGLLSGGERRRLQLIRILLPDPNFLIFDEPTNDLDIRTLSLLEEFLLDFPGCVAVVSHDRYFLDRVAGTLLVLDATGNVREVPESCSEYLARQQQEKRNQKREVPEDAGPSLSKQGTEPKETAAHGKQPNGPETDSNKKLTYAERLEYEALLEEIDRLEGRRAALEAVLSGAESDPGKIREAAAEHARLSEEIDTKTRRWEMLGERV